MKPVPSNPVLGRERLLRAVLSLEGAANEEVAARAAVEMVLIERAYPADIDPREWAAAKEVLGAFVALVEAQESFKDAWCVCILGGSS